MDTSTWTDEECTQLLSNVLEKVKDSHKSFKSDMMGLPWEQLKIEDRTAEDCKTMFGTITQRVRKYRLMSEVIQDAKVALANPKKRQLPPKPKSPYNIFWGKVAKKYMAEGVAFKDLSKHVIDKWHQLSEKKKAKYVRKSDKQKQEYVIKLYDFEKRHPDITVLRPEPPVPRDIYCKSQMDKFRSKHPELTLKEMKEQLYEKYQRLSDKKKLKYIRKAFSKLDQYKRQCETYKARQPRATLRPPKVVLTRQEQILMDQAEGRPAIPPPRNVFYFYCRETNENHQDMSCNEKVKQCGGQYKKLSREQLDALKDRFHQSVRDYVERYTEFYENLTEEQKATEKSLEEVLAPYQKILDPSSAKPRKRRKKMEKASATPSTASSSATNTKSKSGGDVNQKPESPPKSGRHTKKGKSEQESPEKGVLADEHMEKSPSSSRKSPKKKSSPKKMSAVVNGLEGEDGDGADAQSDFSEVYENLQDVKMEDFGIDWQNSIDDFIDMSLTHHFANSVPESPVKAKASEHSPKKKGKKHKRKNESLDEESPKKRKPDSNEDQLLSAWSPLN